MNVKLRKNLEELSFLLRYFNTRLATFRSAGLLRPGFEHFIKECSTVVRQLNLGLKASEILERKLSARNVPIVEEVSCQACGTRTDTNRIAGYYQNEWGWESNVYNCIGCDQLVQGFQPNNLLDLFAFTDFSDGRGSSSKKKSNQNDDKYLDMLLGQMNLSRSKYNELKKMLADNIGRQKRVEDILEKRVSEYCGVLLLEKFRLETGNQEIGNC